MPIPIIDGQMNHGTTFEEHARTFVAAFAKRLGVQVPGREQIAAGEPLPARIDAGRWIVECPDCHDAQYTWPDDPAVLFMCVTCFNGRAGGLWRRVAFPPAALRERVEAVLLKRPVPTQRHWREGWTVKQLRTENLAAGDEF